HTSSRNSEVIHAGIYYPKNSLKARFCVEGKHLLYSYCREREIAHQQIGKVIVATDESERDAVGSYVEKAAANGVNDLRWLSAQELSEMEPALSAIAGV
ncbi:MAG: FAD-dependent oxidoreductase, partial [Burkholderiales bacterium]|nr:FAD-dependent oxidoreductase [Burkholderiales bacterium]